MNKKEDGQKDEIVWRAAEFDYHERDVSWYWAVGTVAAILAMVALWQKNFFFFIFVVLSGILVLVFGRRKPKVIDFRVTDKGIGIGHSIFYKFADLEWFDIKERPGRLNHLVVKRKAMINPIVRIPMDDSLADKAKEFLQGKLEKVDHEDTLVDAISDWLGF